MRHLTYLAVLAGCLAAALVLEPLLKVGVLRRWRRLAFAVLPVAAVFVLWDVAAIAAGHWTYNRGQTTGVLLPGRLPLEELLFFLVVPVCAVLGFEAVRAVRRYPVGDEPPGEKPPGEKPRGGGPPGGGGASGVAGGGRAGR